MSLHSKIHKYYKRNKNSGKKQELSEETNVWEILCRHAKEMHTYDNSEGVYKGSVTCVSLVIGLSYELDLGSGCIILAALKHWHEWSSDGGKTSMVERA